MRQFNTLTGFLLSKSANPTADDTVQFQGFAAIGDGGGSIWKHNGVIGQTPSQSPTQLADNLLNDADGAQWAIVVGQVLDYSGTQWYPLPFGGEGNGGYLFDTLGWEKLAASGLINDLSQAYIFDTVALFKSSLIEFPDGKTIHLNDRDADFTKITGTGTANTFNIIASTSISQSIVFILENKKALTSQLGVSASPNAGLQAAIDNYLTVDVDEDYTVNLDNLFTPGGGLAYNYAVKLRAKSRFISTTGKTITTTDPSGVTVHIPVGANKSKVKDVKFVGGGLSSNDVNNLSFAVATAIDSSITTKDFKDIRVIGCEFSGHNIDIDLRAVVGVKVFHNEHTGTFYSRATGSVAGYQCHIASCEKVERAHNTHTAGGFDRHAFYLATAQAGVNRRVNSHDNTYDWDLTDFTQNPFMAAINLRPGSGIHIHHETINKPHGGGITSVTDNSNSFNQLIIDHNIITDVTTEATLDTPVVVGSGISLRPSGGGSYVDAIIDGNIITTLDSADGSRINAISVSGTDTKVINNKITLNGALQNAINVALGTGRISIDGNTFIGDGTQTSPMFFDLQVAANDFRWGKNIVNGFTGTLLDAFNGTPTYDKSIVCRDVTVKVVSDGIGGITFETDLAVVTSVQAIGGGFSLTFPDWFKPAEKAKQLSSGSALARDFYDANSSGVTNNIIVLDSTGAQIGAATNAYTIYITYKDLRQ